MNCASYYSVHSFKENLNSFSQRIEWYQMKSLCIICTTMNEYEIAKYDDKRSILCNIQRPFGLHHAAGTEVFLMQIKCFK